MLVHRTVIPQHYVAGTHLYTWVERDNVEQSFLSKETTRRPRPGFEAPTFGSETQRVNQFTMALPLLVERSPDKIMEVEVNASFQEIV